MLIQHDDAYYESRKPEPDLGTWRNLKRFIWNPEKKTFLDRSCKSWAQVGLFYVVFFGVIFSLFTFKMWITFNYIQSMHRPYIFVARNVRSLNDASNQIPLLARAANEGPGMSFKPNVLTPMSSPIIWISETSSKSKPIRYVEALDEFFERLQSLNSNHEVANQEAASERCYQTTECNKISASSGYTEDKLRHTAECKNGRARTPEPCFFNVSTLGQCSRPPYGYTNGEPCVIIAFNKMFHWVPDCYNATSDLPSAMPEWLKKIVRQSTEPNVWFSCAGADPVDVDHIGDIAYIPKPGFPLVFFPYFGHRHHMSPLVALQFKNLSVDRLLTVECTAWARNINVRNGYSLEFQIMIGK